MRLIKLFTTLFAISLFLTACGQNQPQQTTTAEPPPAADPAMTEAPIDEYWAKDNLDLQRVGNLLERSNSPEEFERYLNDDDGINNLDLNGDGYVDYVSVEEFEDRDSNSRGLSLFSRFGPDLIQEIASIVFYRDEPRYPGARILLTGNEQLYGDNNYYETNWLDRTLGIASLLFSDRDRYRSPYYYDNYPSWYETYPVVETPFYRTRIERLYPEPLFVYTNAPTFIGKIKIKSPNNGLHLGQIRARLVKPTKEQAEFLKNNPWRRPFAKGDDKPGRDDPPRSDRGDERGNPERDERGAQRGNPDKPDRPNSNPPKADGPGKGQGQDPGKGQGQGPGGHDKGKGQGQGGGQGKGKGKP